MPVHVLTTSARVARQSNGYLKGCKSTLLSSLADTDFAVSETINELKKNDVFSPGDSVVIVYGSSANVGSTNTMKIVYA